MAQAINLYNLSSEPTDFNQLPSGGFAHRNLVLALILGTSLRTLQRWESSGRFPQSIKIGGRCYYRVNEVERWRTDPASYSAK